jgi:LysR family transcriptional regulator, transcription activator of glutamate synthase operon
VNLDELHWFVALAESEHMTDAAAELNITQPTLSRALARLERQIGAPLFDRVNRRLRLNVYGSIMLEHARRSITEIRSASERITALRDPDKGVVRLAFLHSVANWFVPEIIGRFHAQAHEVQFDLSQAAGHELAEALATGQVDLVITTPRPHGDEYGWRELMVERLCVVVPRTHHLAKRRRISLSETADEPFIALGSQFALRQLTNELWAAEGISPRVVFEAMEIATIEGLAAAGLGIAVVPAPQPNRAESTAAYIPLTSAHAKRAVGLAWIKGRAISPAAERFASFVRHTA